MKLEAEAGNPGLRKRHIGCLGWWLWGKEQKRSQSLRGPHILIKRTVDSGKGL